MDIEHLLNNDEGLLLAALNDEYVSQFITEDDLTIQTREFDGMQSQVQIFKASALEDVANRLYDDLGSKFQSQNYSLKTIICDRFKYCKELRKGNRADVLKKLNQFMIDEYGMVLTGILDAMTAGATTMIILAVLGTSKKLDKLCECDVFDQKK